MRELTQLRQQISRTSRNNNTERNENLISVKKTDESDGGENSGNFYPIRSNKVQDSINMVQHAMSSLSGVRDSKKFGEVLDKMFVPTV